MLENRRGLRICDLEAPASRFVGSRRKSPKSSLIILPTLAAGRGLVLGENSGCTRAFHWRHPHVLNCGAFGAFFSCSLHLSRAAHHQLVVTCNPPFLANAVEKVLPCTEGVVNCARFSHTNFSWFLSCCC